jgi:hypothetical protein
MSAKFQGHFSLPPCFTPRCLWCNQRALVDKSGAQYIRNDRSAWDALYDITPQEQPVTSKISSLMMEAARTSETSVDNHFTRQYNPEDSSEQ